MLPKGMAGEHAVIERLLQSLGVRRRQDPFAHLEGPGEAGADWFQARIMGSCKRGACPLCEAYESGLVDYLFWLPVNLRDADFFLSLCKDGGFCTRHLDQIIVFLHDFPYGQVRLFAFLHMLLEERGPAPRRFCHLCNTMSDSQRLYAAVLANLMSGENAGIDTDALASCLCEPHRRAMAGNAIAGRRGARHQAIALHGPGIRKKAELERALEEVVRGFHLMHIEELKNKLQVCDHLLRKAIDQQQTH